MCFQFVIQNRYWETFQSKTKAWQSASDCKCYTDKNKWASNIIFYHSSRCRLFFVYSEYKI